MFSLRTFLRGCLHDVHACYLFDPLLPQGMEVETLCRTRVVVSRLLMPVGHYWERLQAPRALYVTLYFIACSAQAVHRPC